VLDPSRNYESVAARVNDSGNLCVLGRRVRMTPLVAGREKVSGFCQSLFVSFFAGGVIVSRVL
jgi:hypothetical protein